MSEPLYRYGFVVDDTDVIDTMTIPNHTILYQKRDGLWQAYLECWIDDDAGNFTVVYESEKHTEIQLCCIEIKEFYHEQRF